MVRPNTLSLQNDHTTKKQEGDHMSHAYEDTLRTMYNAFAQGDVETVIGLLTDDIEYHISGHSPVSGSYSGKDEVLGFFGKLMQQATTRIRRMNSGRKVHSSCPDVVDTR